MKKIFLPIFIAVVFSSIGFCQGEISIESRLSGEKMPDFTVTYSVTKKSRLANLSQKEIEDAVNLRVQQINSRVTQGKPPIDLRMKDQKVKTLSFMQDIAKSDSLSNPKITISQRGNSLLVKWLATKDKGTVFLSRNSKGTTFLYDGKQTIFRHLGADTQITPGFDYGKLNDFIFPGRGLKVLPMARHVEGNGSEKNCQFFANSGISDFIRNKDGSPNPKNKSVVPQLWPGKIITSNDNGKEHLVKIIAGNNKQSTQEITYGPDKSKGNVAFPETIHMTSSFNPEWILPFGPYEEMEYTLVDMSDQPLPEKEFHAEGIIPKKTIVQDNTPGKTTAVLMEEGKSLRDQLDEQYERDTRTNAKNDKGNNKTSFALVIALLLGGTGFFLWRRSKSL
jgi:hypothetical protein